MCSAGVTMVAALWLRELTQLAVLDAVVGAVYLVSGIGLFGHSRFSLILGIVIPLGVSGAFYASHDLVLTIDNLRYATDGVIAGLCVVVLWMVRHEESR